MTRLPFLADLCYPSDPKKLSAYARSFFAAEGGPGPAPRTAGSPPALGLVAPHIDFNRGKAGYAWAYREVFRSGLADLYVLLGVAHATPPTPLVLCRKDYATPLGTASVDRKLARALAEAAPYDLSADEAVHDDEHSLEFQAVMLRYVQAEVGGDFKILPILASCCDLRGSEPGRRTMAVLESLAKILKSYRGRVCLLAGVDFAHIGPHFGDAEPVTPRFIARTERQDRASIARLLDLDPEGFLKSVMDDGNARKVCGVCALHAFTWLMRRLHPKAQGSLLHYGHAADPSGGEVTFASLVFR